MAELFQLFLLGLISGTTVCGIACFSYLGPYLLGAGCGFCDGVVLTLHYLAGKILLYMFFGGIAGWAGAQYAPLPHADFITGSLFILIGLLVPVWNRRSCSVNIRQKGKRSSLFTLGLLTSLSPCPSLIALLGIAAASGSMASGILNGAGFGLGLLVSPMILAGGILSRLAYGLRLETALLQTVFQGFAMFIFISLGVKKILEI